MSNYLYVAGAAEGPVKIGFSNNPASRMASISNASPVPVAMHACYAVGDHHREVERTVHFVLRDKRVNGEWFEITADEAVEAVARTAALVGLEMTSIPTVKGKRVSLTRRGRPSTGKQVVSLRLDPAVIAKFKATGRGWQGRMNEALKAAKL